MQANKYTYSLFHLIFWYQTRTKGTYTSVYLSSDLWFNYSWLSNIIVFNSVQDALVARLLWWRNHLSFCRYVSYDLNFWKEKIEQCLLFSHDGLNRSIMGFRHNINWYVWLRNSGMCCINGLLIFETIHGLLIDGMVYWLVRVIMWSMSALGLNRHWSFWNSFLLLGFFLFFALAVYA